MRFPALMALCWVFVACGNEATPDEGTGATGGTGGATAGTGGSAGMVTGGAAGSGGAGATAGTQGGSASGAGGSAGSAGAGQAGLGAGGASGAGGTATGGASGTSGAAGMSGASGGGMSGAGGNTAGAAGTAGGGTSGSSGGGAGGAGGEPTGGSAGTAGMEGDAVAVLMPTSGNEVSGTGVFTVDGDNVVLTISLVDCPPGDHASHIHENKDCGDDGAAAGNHWVPEGEVIEDITCESDGTGMLVVTPPAGTWSVGEGDNDVTQFAMVVHAGDSSNAGGRIACGVINASR